MRVLLWHGWLLEGSGSNVLAAKVTESLRRSGHDVVLLCQARDDSIPTFIDDAGSVAESVSALRPNPHAAAHPSGGRAVLLRPDIGSLLPVFVVDEYEGFTVKRFVDLAPAELDAYLESNVVGLRAAAAWQRSDVVIASHVVPGAVVAARALGHIPFVALTHGSELEYAVRVQDRYGQLAREGLERAARVAGGGHDVLDRALAFAPTASERAVVIPPGVDVERFRPMPRREALDAVSTLLDRDPDTAHGRPPGMAERLAGLIGADPDGPESLALTYDQNAPDADAASRLRRLSDREGPTVAYLGKLIPQKGVEVFVQALALLPPEVDGLVVGFGQHREWLEALASAIDGGGNDLDWIRAHSGLQIEWEAPAPADGSGLSERLTFTGRLDHRYAPMALAAADVLVVPSVIPEAFAMVTVEGAAAGCLPMVARHSGLAEVAEAMESHVGRPGIFGFESGEGSVRRLAEGIALLLAIPSDDREDLRRQVSALARATWTWDHTAEQLIRAGRRDA